MVGYYTTDYYTTILLYGSTQVVGCPLLVELSTRVGRVPVLIAALLGSAASAALTAAAPGVNAVAAARALGGFFAASIPVAQVHFNPVIIRYGRRRPRGLGKDPRAGPLPLATL